MVHRGAEKRKDAAACCIIPFGGAHTSHSAHGAPICRANGIASQCGFCSCNFYLKHLVVLDKKHDWVKFKNQRFKLPKRQAEI